MKKFRQRQLPFGNGGIRSIIFLYFTITAAAASIFIGLSLYTRMSGQASENSNGGKSDLDRTGKPFRGKLSENGYEAV